METNWAAEHLQTIRTLMERSAVYRRALAPIMTCAGVLGVAGGIAGWTLNIQNPQVFVFFWGGIAIAAVIAAFLLVRRQALKDAEPFWSPPTRRVAQGLLPPLFIGMITGMLPAFLPGWDFVQPWGLPALWMLLYGCALNAAGFFMTRGIRLFGWIFILSGCASLGSSKAFGPLPMLQEHLVMGIGFGGLHLAYGIYLYFTEKGKNAT